MAWVCVAVSGVSCLLANSKALFPMTSKILPGVSCLRMRNSPVFARGVRLTRGESVCCHTNAVAVVSITSKKRHRGQYVR